MQYIYKFDLNERITLDTYIDFIELYLKNNKILKKEFFEKTDICANSYRFFLTHREKNRSSYYTIISKTYGMYIPDEEEMKELSLQYSKIVEDILYKRVQTYDENIQIIENVLNRYNPKHEDKIVSIEGILFNVLEIILKLSLTKCTNAEKCSILSKYISKMNPYASLIQGIYKLLFQMTAIYYDGFVNKTISYAMIDQAMEATKNYKFLQPLLYSVLSDVYFNCKEYSNSALASNQAYEGFIQSYNFQRAIPAKITAAYTYMYMDSYYNTYQTLSQLYLSLDSYTEEQKSKIVQGLVDSYIFLERYQEVSDFVENNQAYLTIDMEVEKLIALCKLKRTEEFAKEKEAFLEKYKDSRYEGYQILVENIQLLMYKEKLQLKKREAFSTMINAPEKKILFKICKKLFNKNRF